MISIKDLKELGMCDMYDYYGYVEDSYIRYNNIAVTKLLIEDMSRKQHNDFLLWLDVVQQVFLKD